MLRTESEIQNTINSWLSSFFDEETKNNIQELKANNPEELQDSFYKNLEFGWHCGKPADSCGNG